MARYKDYNFDQMKMIPVSFDQQILPGSFEYSLAWLVDNEPDLSAFAAHYRNKEMFAIDGCKLPSNASKSWRGTYAELNRKRQKNDRAVRRMLQRHREQDGTEQQPDIYDREREQIKKLRVALRKIKEFLNSESERTGVSGRVVKNNKITPRQI